jgi:hypothetical protein
MKIRDMRKMSIGSIDGKEKLLVRFQSAKDIAKSIREDEKESRNFAKKLVPFFKSNSEIKTCKRVWLFLRVGIRYGAEPKTRQTTKSIARFIADRKGDCKHYATASVGILNACNIPAWFVVVRQSSSDKTRFHAYCCALVDNKVVVIDPCRKVFNSECNFVKKYNIAPLKK